MEIFAFCFFLFFFWVFAYTIRKASFKDKHLLNRNKLSNSENIHKGFQQLLNDLDFEEIAQKHLSTKKIKNLEAEALERTQQKEKTVKNQKSLNLEGEGLKIWKKKKEEQKNKSYRNIEKEALENAQSHAKSSIQKKSANLPNAQITDLPKKNYILANLQSKKELKNAFLLQEILKRPEY